MRCRHLTAVVHEQVTANSIWEIEDGKVVNDVSSMFGDPTGVLFVHCKGCGLKKQYGLRGRPKWLQRLYGAISEYQPWPV